MQGSQVIPRVWARWRKRRRMFFEQMTLPRLPCKWLSQASKTGRTVVKAVLPDSSHIEISLAILASMQR